jgi:predicted DNA-binding ribbon-helix-helix protein
MKSPVAKRSIVVRGHKTSVSLEDAFWNSLKEIGGERHMTLSDLVAAIDSQRQHGNLSSAIRLFVLDFYCAQLSDADEGHNEAQHDGTDGARLFSQVHSQTHSARTWPLQK